MKVKVTSNLRGLNKIIKDLESKPAHARVGVLKKDAQRESSGTEEGSSGDKINNAYIGLIHEYGSVDRNIPARSFLNGPLKDKLKEDIDKAAKGKKIDALDVFATHKLMEKVGQLAFNIVKGAFRTGGYGNWAARSSRENNTGDLLVDTTKLRDSIDYEVKKKT